MTITKYRTRFKKIEAVQVDRETVTSVWIDGRRNAKRTSYASFFDTWKDAHDYLLADADAELMTARRRLQRAQSEYGNVKGMKPPKGETE